MLWYGIPWGEKILVFCSLGHLRPDLIGQFFRNFGSHWRWGDDTRALQISPSGADISRRLDLKSNISISAWTNGNAFVFVFIKGLESIHKILLILSILSNIFLHISRQIHVGNPRLVWGPNVGKNKIQIWVKMKIWENITKKFCVWSRLWICTYLSFFNLNLTLFTTLAPHQFVTLAEVDISFA
jgi:hypothetical protein